MKEGMRMGGQRGVNMRKKKGGEEDSFGLDEIKIKNPNFDLNLKLGNLSPIPPSWVLKTENFIWLIMVLHNGDRLPRRGTFLPLNPTFQFI